MYSEQYNEEITHEATDSAIDSVIMVKYNLEDLEIALNQLDKAWEGKDTEKDSRVLVKQATDDVRRLEESLENLHNVLLGD